jgi:hypothetical protein
MALRLQLAEAEYDRRREDVPRNQLRMDIAASYVANRGRVGLCWIIAYAKQSLHNSRRMPFTALSLVLSGFLRAEYLLPRRRKLCPRRGFQSDS